MKKVRKPSPTESSLLFEISAEPIPETLTALGGVPLLVQAFRSLGLPARVREHVRIKERDRGYDEATMVESFVVLNAVGGECCDDFERLREDPGLSELIGHGVPSPAVARKFLNQFHAEEKIEAAKLGRVGDQIAYIPEENAPLDGLGMVTGPWCRSWGGGARISASRRWIRMRRSLGAASSSHCALTKESGATSRCWRCGRN